MALPQIDSKGRSSYSVCRRPRQLKLRDRELDTRAVNDRERDACGLASAGINSSSLVGGDDDDTVVTKMIARLELSYWIRNIEPYQRVHYSSRGVQPQ